MSRAILVIGPNGVGKTKFAYNLARRSGADVINADRAYLYKNFPITTGLQDTLTEQGIHRHFYELLDPEEESYPASLFTKMIVDKSKEVFSFGKDVVIEGGSTVYVPHMLEFNEKQKIFDKIIGLRFAKNEDITTKYKNRIEQAFANGLAQELILNMVKYKKSYLIKECHFAIPTIGYIEGILTLEQAKDEILQKCLLYKDRQLEIFSKFSDIEWIDSPTKTNTATFKLLDYLISESRS